MTRNEWKSAYSQKLRDPKWQAVRLQVLDRDERACVLCGEDDIRLEVHHLYYLSGCEPWEYPLSALCTLCDKCHHREYEHGKENTLLLTQELKRVGFFSFHLLALVRELSTWGPAESFGDRNEQIEALAWAAGQPLIMAELRSRYRNRPNESFAEVCEKVVEFGTRFQS